MATSPKPRPDSTVSTGKGITGKFSHESHRETCPERLASCVPMGCLATPMEFLRTTARDLQRKLTLFKEYYKRDRVHQGLDRAPPNERVGNTHRKIARLDDYRWEARYRGLYQLPAAA